MGFSQIVFCKWDLAALLLIAVITAAIVVHNFRHGKKTEQIKKNSCNEMMRDAAVQKTDEEQLVKK